MSLPLTFAGHSAGSDPTSISGLIGWWDFGDAANLAINDDGTGGPPADTGNIKYCRDLSGLGNHMTERSGVGFPTWAANSINGKGTGLFSSAVLESTANLILPAAEITIIGIAARTAAGGATICPLFTGGVTSYTVAGSLWFQLHPKEAGNWMLDGSATTIDESSSTPWDSTYRLCTVMRTTAPLSYIYINGVLASSGHANAYALASNKPAFIGAWGGNYMNGKVACVLVYDRALTAAEQLQVEVYLANRFGIYHPSATWPWNYSRFHQASILDNTLNVNQIGGATDTLKYCYLGDNIDGLSTDNASLADHGLVATWDNRGTTGATGDATQATASAKPSIEKDIEGSSNDGVAFGGNGDFMTIGGSQAGLAFIDTTGIYDIVVVGRRDIQNASVILCSTENSAEDGFDLAFSGSNTVTMAIYTSAAALLDFGSTQTFPLGSTFLLEAKGSGTVGYLSNDMVTFDSFAMDVTFGSGDATNTCRIGSHITDTNESYDGAIFAIGIYTAQLSTAARALLKAGLVAQYDV